MIKLPKIYAITDPRISSLTHVEQVERLIEGGAELVQIRDKYASAKDFYEIAVAAVTTARARGARVIINDRVDIALCAGAAGVHLGQDDMPPQAARRLLGEEAVIGFSTHSVEQAVEAVRQLPIDYIAIGPIFSTRTKQDPDPVVGIDGLRQVRNAIGTFPLVAIGGITGQNAAAVFAAGADSAAVISDLLSDPSKIVERFHALASTTNPGKSI